MKIVIAGSSGLVGTALQQELKSKGHEVVTLNRSRMGDWVNEIEGAGAAINLAGEPIAGKRWSPKQKQIIRDSRIQTTRAIVEGIRRTQSKPEVLINASAIGFYGPRGDEKLDENSTSKGTGFLADTCAEWENEALKVKNLGVRLVLLRTGIILAKNGGAMTKMLPPFRLGLGGPIGNGQQYMSWIHLADEVGAIIKTLEDKKIQGPVNLTAPQSVPMKIFTKDLGRELRRPAIFLVPGFVLKFVLGEMSEMLLTGQNVYPTKLVEAGYHFKYPALDSALHEILNK